MDWMSDSLTVPIATLRRVCGAEAGEIEGLVRSRQIAVKAGKTPLVAGVRAYLDAIRAEARNSSLAAARQEAQSARAEAMELDLDMDEGRLVDDDAAQVAVADLCGAILREFHSAPARVTRDLHQRRTIESALHEAQNELANGFREAATETKSKPRKTRKWKS